MNTDTEIRVKGVEALVSTLGIVEAERFIALMNREPFDYTKWRRNLWEDETVESISKRAMAEIEEAEAQ
jgi:hypothetical protein